MEVYSEVLSRVRGEYVEEPNLPAVTDGALHGLLESLDSNSSYLNAEQYKTYKNRKPGVRGEIGAAISKRFGYASVVAVIPGGQAETNPRARCRWLKLTACFRENPAPT